MPVPKDDDFDSHSFGLFDPDNLDRTIIAVPLWQAIQDVREAWSKLDSLERDKFDTLIFLSRKYPEGLKGAAKAVKDRFEVIKDRILKEQSEANQGDESSSAKEVGPEPILGEFNARRRREFLLARMTRDVRLLLQDLDRGSRFQAIDRIRTFSIEVIIDLNIRYPGGTEAARQRVFALLNKLTGVDSDRAREESTTQYVFANLRWDQIEELVKLDTKAAEEDRQRANSPDEKPDAFRAIFRIWPNFEIRPCLMDSLTTVKADAAQISFTALGQSITWAVIDSGIHSRHPHFHLHGNVNPRSPLHRDFTLNANNVSDPNNAEVLSSALIDGFGHGTHVAGIIAGEHDGDHPSAGKKDLQGFRRQRSEREVEAVELQIRRIRGVAPKCSLVSLKVLDDRGYGDVGNVIRALTYVLKVNGNGSEEQVIHGVNISLGYDFDPEWFACGESPVCNEVNRLVRSGVVVVVAAGNTGYGYFQSLNRTTKAGLGVTINDPGNAELAVTVGSTHRKMPHRYGVSYFSSKGPTSDGRAKPDLIAPGEKILSCAQGDLLRKKLEGVSTSPNMEFHYLEESGTSMAAPHVSGVIAAFLSVRQEFIGHPWRLKEIFMSTATDLRRDRYFQGAGLIDLMRAIQSV